jgi:hypothetical protein
VFFHFYAFRIFTPWLFEQGGHPLTAAQRRLIYAPYVVEIQRAIRAVRLLIPGFAHGFAKPGAGLLLFVPRFRRFIVSLPGS